MADIRRQHGRHSLDLERDMLKLLAGFIALIFLVLAARFVPLLVYFILLAAALYAVRWAMDYWDAYSEGPGVRERLDASLAGLPDDCIILRDLRLTLGERAAGDETDERPPARPLLRLLRREEPPDTRTESRASHGAGRDGDPPAGEPRRGEDRPAVIALGEADDADASEAEQGDTVQLDYLLLAPWGLYGIRVEEREGRVWVKDGSWFTRGSVGRAVKLPDPLRRARLETRALTRHIEEHWEEIFRHARLHRRVQVRPLVVFAGEELDLDPGPEPLPAVTMEQLAEYLEAEADETEDLVVTGAERDQLAEYLMTVR